MLEGELTLTVEGEDRTLERGEELTIQPNQEHAFRNNVDEFTSVVVEMSSMIDYEAQVTLFGMDHEGRVGDDGEPPLLQAIMMTKAMRKHTVFTPMPLPILRVL